MTRLSKISIIIFITTFLVQIGVSNHMSIKTQEFNEVQREISELQNRISIINQEIYLSSSITGMEERAQKNGFMQMAESVKTISNPTIARAF